MGRDDLSWQSQAAVLPCREGRNFIHIASYSTPRVESGEQRMCLLYFFLTQSTTLYPGDSATQSALGLPRSTNLIKTISNDTQDNPVKTVSHSLS